MITTIILGIALIAAAFFSAESIVVTVAGFAATSLATQGLKYKVNVQGSGSVLLAIVLSVVIACAGILAASFMGGEGFSLDAIVKQSGQIFTLATLAYHVFRPLGEDGNK